MQPNYIITYVYTVWKKDISTVIFKNKLATCIIGSNIDKDTSFALEYYLTDTKFSAFLSLQIVRLLKLRANFRLRQKIWKVISYFKEGQEVIWIVIVCAVATFSGCSYQ